jgi:hypothetical protein
VENLTALEYTNREWKLFEYQRDMKEKQPSITTEKRIQNIDLNYNFLLEELLTNN